VAQVQQPAFTVRAEVRRRILLVRCGGVVTADDLTALEALARRFVHQHGPLPTIVDLSAVRGLAVPTGVVAALAQRPPIMGDQVRAYVVPNPEAFGLARLYATYQALAGFKPPRLARTLDEALAVLDVDDAGSRPSAPAAH
jgi:hypothetical protein